MLWFSPIRTFALARLNSRSTTFELKILLKFFIWLLKNLAIQFLHKFPSINLLQKNTQKQFHPIELLKKNHQTYYQSFVNILYKKFFIKSSAGRHIGFTVFILTITTQQIVRLIFHNCFPICCSGHYSLLSTGHGYSTPARRIVSHDRIIQQAKLLSQDLLLVPKVGLEPTMSSDGRVWVCWLCQFAYSGI